MISSVNYHGPKIHNKLQLICEYFSKIKTFAFYNNNCPEYFFKYALQ